MIIGILAYLAIAMILYILEYDKIKTYGNIAAKSYFFTPNTIIAICLFGLFYGVRYETGVDNLEYIRSYELAVLNATPERATSEVIYQFVQNAFAFCGFHFSIFIGFWGALQIGLLLYATRNWKYVWPYLCVFFVLGPYFLDMANIMRQTTTFCLFAVMIEFIFKKNFLIYVSLNVIAFFIHKSAILFLPMYLILRFPLYPKYRILSLSIFVVATIVGNTPTWLDIFQNLGDILTFLNYDGYVENLDVYISKTRTIAWGPGRIAIWILMALTMWYYYPLNDKYKFDKRIKAYFTCFFYGACLYNLVLNAHQVFSRPTIYLYDFYVLVIPVCLFYLKRNNQIFKFLVYFFLANIISIYYTVHGSMVQDATSKYEIYRFFFWQ